MTVQRASDSRMYAVGAGLALATMLFFMLRDHVTATIGCGFFSLFLLIKGEHLRLRP